LTLTDLFRDEQRTRN